jgi:hypothetical protein
VPTGQLYTISRGDAAPNGGTGASRSLDAVTAYSQSAWNWNSRKSISNILHSRRSYEARIGYLPRSTIGGRSLHSVVLDKDALVWIRHTGISTLEQRVKRPEPLLSVPVRPAQRWCSTRVGPCRRTYGSGRPRRSLRHRDPTSRGIRNPLGSRSSSFPHLVLILVGAAVEACRVEGITRDGYPVLVHSVSFYLWAGSRGAATPAGPLLYPTTPLYAIYGLLSSYLLVFC